MRNKWVKAAAVTAAGASAFMALGWSFFKMIVYCKKSEKKELKKQWFTFAHMKINHPRNKFEQEYEDGKAWCRNQPMKDCYIKSDDGLILHAYYLPADDPKRVLLLSHGYKGSGFGDFAYTAEFLHDNGCSLFFIDQRCCGLSEGEYITFGAKEQYDVVKWTWYIHRINHNRLPVYLYGESMGAAAVLMSLKHKLPTEVKGVISDCAFSSMKEQLRNIASEWFHVKWIELLLFRVDIFCRIFGDFKMKDADTTEALKVNRRPVLFFHGLKDTYVSPKNTEYNYRVCKAPKEIYMIPEARHLCSAYEQRDFYRGKLLKFFERYDIMSKGVDFVLARKINTFANDHTEPPGDVI